MVTFPPSDPSAPPSNTSGPPTDPSASHRLPYDVVPRRYDLRLAPDLGAATFAGDVRITAEVQRPVDRVELHAAELVVTSATVTGSDGRGRPALVSHDDASERLVLTLDEALPAGSCTIDMSFTGVLNDRLHGFYRSTFTDDAGTTHTIATTQFEATDARRAFPCFDEPDRKAVFAVTLDVDEGLAAFSNGSVLSEAPLGGGRRRVQFADTIPMSTYLVAFVVGPLHATEPLDVDGVAVRVVHVPGRQELTGFAVDCAAHALRFFAEWFDMAYPSDKLDLVAIPDFAFGAMENLGCVTFRETALLLDPERSSQLEQQRVADVVSHEIAHMWFGDMVTMKWWNGIWLNEAFATLMELLCVDHYRPQWRRWVSFGMERDVAMATDALHRTRPVEYPVGPPEEAQGMFDVLTYQKGASVLRMLERFLGEERFRAGIRRYLARHRLGNTDTADLWDAIEEASGEPVRQIMDSWILQGGFPLVTAMPEGDVTVLHQAPFELLPADATGSADAHHLAGAAGSGRPDGSLGAGGAPATAAMPSAIGDRWQVPVLVRALGTDIAGSEPTRVLLGDGPARVAVDPGVVVVNAGGSGYYRVRYPAEHLRRLAGGLQRLDPLERFNLLGDTWASVLAGRGQLDDVMVLAEALRDERDPDVWGQATGALRFLDHVLPDDSRATLAAYTRALVGPVLHQLGWERGVGEDDRTVTLRALAVGLLGTVGADDDVRRHCQDLHQAALSGTAIDPDLAAAVVGVVASAGDRSVFEELLDRYRHPATPQEEMRYLYALGQVPDPAVGAEVFDLALTEIRTQNAPFVVQLLLTSREHGPATWQRLQERWDEVMARTPANMAPRLIDGVKWLCRERTLADGVVRFLAAHPVRSGQRSVEQTLERLQVNVTVTERLTPTAGEVLRAATDRLAGQPS